MTINTIEEAAACEAAMRNLVNLFEILHEANPDYIWTHEQVLGVISGQADMFERVGNRLIGRIVEEV